MREGQARQHRVGNALIVIDPLMTMGQGFN